MLGRIVPVIMCGGTGTRLWPVSRESMPKQFVPIVGSRSTFQQVLARVNDAELFVRPIVITNTDFRLVVAEQLRERGVEADIVARLCSMTRAPAAGRDPSWTFASMRPILPRPSRPSLKGKASRSMSHATTRSESLDFSRVPALVYSRINSGARWGARSTVVRSTPNFSKHIEK